MVRYPKPHLFVWVLLKNSPYVKLSFYDGVGFMIVDGLGGFAAKREYYNDVKKWYPLTIPKSLRFFDYEPEV